MSFFTVFLVLWCFLTLVVVVVVVSVVALSAGFCAANAAVPRTIAAPIINAENFFMIIFFLFWGGRSPSYRQTFRYVESTLIRS